MSEDNGNWAIAEDGAATRVLGFMPDETQMLEVVPTRYRIELFDELGIDPTHTFHSYGGWNVEGDFLMVYEGDTKTGYRIPTTTAMIKTTEEPIGRLVDQNDDPVESDVELDNHAQDEAVAELPEVRQEVPDAKSVE
jgi:hypothetical protein